MNKFLVPKDHPALRSKAGEIPLRDIGSERIQNLVKDMKDTVHACDDGIALAAPQIGESLRMFVISEKFLTRQNIPRVYINPKLIKSSKNQILHEEGCLSLRWLYGKIKRAEKVTIECYDEHGNRIRRGASGLLAEVYQHEIEHLDGILFVDHAKNIKEIFPTPRFAFFGTSSFATIVLDELESKGFTPALLVANPDAPVGRKMILTPPPVKSWALERNIPLIQPRTLKDEISELSSIDKKWDLFIVSAYGKMIPKSILDIPRYGVLNVHPSLLPLFRGPTPIQTAILDGANMTGVSIMLVDEKMDHGPVLRKRSFSLEEWSPTSKELGEKLAREGGKLLAETIPDWIGNMIRPVVQDDASATVTKKFLSDDGYIPAKEVESEESDRKIRAFYPEPGTYTFFEKKDKKLRVKLLPGKRVIPDGRREMSWKEFQRGFLKPEN